MAPPRAIVALLVLAVLAVSCAAGAQEPAETVPTEQRSEGGGVEIVATWVATDPPSIEVKMDTHSVDLDRLDLAALSRARVDGGAWVAPSAVDVPKGGHHREGRLLFDALRPSFAAARVIELEIRDVAVPVRLLRWERG